VLDPEVKGKAARGYLWFYAVPGGDVVLVFNRSRGLDAVKDRLKGFEGTIQTDAYDVYESLANNQPSIKRNGCLAHVRRRFYAALRQNFSQAVWFIAQIRLLYRIEDEIEHFRLIVTLRQGRRRNLKAMKDKAEELKPTLRPSTIGDAVRYFL
jgi:hypothetical protein